MVSLGVVLRNAGYPADVSRGRPNVPDTTRRRTRWPSAYWSASGWGDYRRTETPRFCRAVCAKEISVCFEEKKRLGVPFGILFMDIDHFKIFNDTYGHDVGDRVLRFVAETLVKNARPFDLIGRWGGEEFLGIIRNVSWQQLEDLGNRLRVLVESAYIQAESEKLHVSISIGATLVCDEDSMETVIKRADTLLYESKRSGRNRLTIG